MLRIMQDVVYNLAFFVKNTTFVKKFVKNNYCNLGLMVL